MRARWLKPEFFKDRKIGVLGPIPALVYQALWCLADDSGMAPCDPEVIKGEMFVHWSSVGLPEISEALRQLYTAQRIHFFQGSDELFAEIANFPKHQKVHNPSKHRNALVYKDFLPTLPQWCGSPPEELGSTHHLDSYIARELESKTPKILDTKIFTPQAESADAPKKVAREVKGKPWVGRLREVLKAHYGVEPKGKWWTASVEPLVNEHGIEAVTDELDAYCSITGMEYLAPPKFAEFYGGWRKRCTNGAAKSAKLTPAEQTRATIALMTGGVA